MTAKAVKTAPMTLASALINASKKEARSDFVVFQRTASDERSDFADLAHCALVIGVAN